MVSKNIVIVGGGFGGLNAAKRLNKNKNRIFIIDKTNHHLFQPLLYQVATAALSPGDIAIPIRSVFNGEKNIEIIMEEVLSVDKIKSCVKLKESDIQYDYLILAPGSSHSYFGRDEWEKYAPGLKTLSDALYIRDKMLRSFEQAEITDNKLQRDMNMTFVIIGGGPTGVETAGALAEISKQTMLKDFRNIKPEEAHIYLIEAAPRILNTYSEKLSEIALNDLTKMGVHVITDAKVTEINEGTVKTGTQIIRSNNIIWAAGNKASSLLKSLNSELDRSGRVFVEKDLSLKGFPNIFIIGDAANVRDREGNTLPGIAPVAIQQGKYVADIINREQNGKARKEFRYFDKGMMATVGKNKAIAKIRKLEFSRFTAWLLWSFIHIFFLITFRNRFRVMGEWIFYYFTSRRGVRLITGRNRETG